MTIRFQWYPISKSCLALPVAGAYCATHPTRPDIALVVGLLCRVLTRPSRTAASRVAASRTAASRAATSRPPTADRRLPYRRQPSHRLPSRHLHRLGDKPY